MHRVFLVARVFQSVFIAAISLYCNGQQLTGVCIYSTPSYNASPIAKHSTRQYCLTLTKTLDKSRVVPMYIHFKR